MKTIKYTICFCIFSIGLHWPLIGGGYEYGIQLKKEDKVYQFYLNEQLEPMDKDNKQIAQLVQEFKPEIAALFEKANAMWDLE
ncbi:hypothetical protein [Bacillus sp. FJAT-28004]|uniref:hypothetical protein n=1 Tax=Bacillus sp. FJAT-28004 TaxID=1679165 RepID=UPI0006B5AE47|nr:hypothetical protein [Bacillus sp. FJAT-28004]